MKLHTEEISSASFSFFLCCPRGEEILSREKLDTRKMLHGPRAWTSCPTLPLRRSSIKINIDEPRKDLIGCNSFITLSPLSIQKSLCIFDLLFSGLSQQVVFSNCILSILDLNFKLHFFLFSLTLPFFPSHSSSHN